LFLALFTLTLFAEFIANDKPLLLRYEGKFYYPVFVEYPETLFGGFLPTEADYRDPEVASLIEEKGWMLWPPVPYSYDTINYNSTITCPCLRPHHLLQTTGSVPMIRVAMS
jgi:microcin C transport system permease protein